jgi:hypothetical protein
LTDVTKEYTINKCTHVQMTNKVLFIVWKVDIKP